ncbi:MAG: tRNA (guanosine(37)-N1)-methyltransferase TrmD [Lachnospiraceae bacterium]|nr:tRNA (guanosine(37)-N1)-methyltransferase TrmD [Lachnospiraceae bacterium]
MNYYVLTLFPEMVDQGLDTSIIGRARKKGLLEVDAINIRDFAGNHYGKVDDYPYGGGAGMLMQPEPVYRAWEEAVQRIRQKKAEAAAGTADEPNSCIPQTETGEEPVQPQTDNIRKADCPEHFEADRGSNATAGKPRVVYLTPTGRVFNQAMAREFAKEENLIFLCGHYEGIDERVVEEIVTDPVSIGDYVLTGGELAAMVMIDTISRLIPGVLNNESSAETESFSRNLLEYPQYTRPEVWHGKRVPEVLLSGHHGNVDRWREEQALKRTGERRPDLL